MNICETPLYQWLDKLQRPVARWLVTFLCIAYGSRAVLGHEVNELLWSVYAAAAGFTYWQRGAEKLKEMEIER